MSRATFTESADHRVESLKGLLCAYRKYDEELKDLRMSLLQRTSDLLGLPDPLSANLGTHDWLWRKREENYSAWLAWCLSQIQPSGVLQVLGIDPPIQVIDEPGFPRAQCEVWVPHGHEGKPGKLDILLELSPAFICAVEVKLVSADDEHAEIGKHKGYVRSLEKMYPDSERGYVLIATGGQDDDYDGFRLRQWREISLALRSQLRRLNLKQDIIKAAMISGFIGAVEQNILALSIPELRIYLEEFLTETV